MRAIRFSKTEWALPFCIMLTLAFALSGCFGARSRPPEPGTDGSLTGIPALIQRISLVFAAMATVALFFAGIAAWFVPNKLAVAKYAAVAFGVLISAGLLYSLAEHWGLAIGLGGAALVAGIVGYAYLHKKDINRRLCRVLNTPKKD